MSTHGYWFRFRSAMALALALVALFSTSACRPGSTRIFVANAGDNTVSVIDHEQEREIKVIPVSEFPQGLALRSDPPLLAVSNSNAHVVSFIDPVTLEKSGEDVRVGYFPIGLAFSPDGRSLYSANYESGSVSVIDVDSRTVAEPAIAVGPKPDRLTLSPDGSLLFVTQHRKPGTLVVIDTATRQVKKRVPVGPFPTDLALRPDGSTLFVASFNAGTVDEIDLTTLELLRVHQVEVGYGLLVDPKRPLLYSILSMEGQVEVYDYKERQERATFDVGEDPVYSAITPDGRFLYVVNGTDRNVMKVDTSTNEVKIRIAVGAEPAQAIVFPMHE